MPLYVLGLMGMTRRLNHTENPAWHIYLIIAAIGVAVILCGIVCQILQIMVSIRDRDKLRDTNGDTWGSGRTLEWSISSPPPFYNFAETPTVRDHDAWWDMKQNGYVRRTEKFARIHMPKNTATEFPCRHPVDPVRLCHDLAYLVAGHSLGSGNVRRRHRPFLQQ